MVGLTLSPLSFCVPWHLNSRYFSKSGTNVPLATLEGNRERGVQQLPEQAGDLWSTVSFCSAQSATSTSALQVDRMLLCTTEEEKPSMVRYTAEKLGERNHI